MKITERKLDQSGIAALRSVILTAALKVAAVVAAFTLAPVFAQTAKPDAVVAIHPGHYTWTGREFHDLASLEAIELPRTPQVVGLFACGPETSRRLVLAAYRFRHMHLVLRILRPEEPDCAPGTAARVLVAGMAFPELPVAAEDEEAAARWWQQMSL